MNMELFHSLILASSLGLSYVVTSSYLHTYQLQITAVLFIIYFFAKRLFKTSTSRYDLLDASMFTFVILNIILATGAIHSPFFFLSYFLIFSLALLLEPTSAIFASISLVFLLFLSQGITSHKDLIALASLPLMTPFALLLGNEYEKNKRLKEKTQNLTRVKLELEEKMNSHKKESSQFFSLIIKSQLKSIEQILMTPVSDRLIIAEKKLSQTEKLLDSYNPTN